ncbi:hypothetical protein PILCRDRAFT_8175 [Piloderma croceum F 1598]|uniref:Uncharacterized protein n=1 Tax=Piloderma croceum (strain F 1598) TaxID=765440 RepID=A0A0C3FU05_PILCF|nr:hypothetical protein PILCRDRAFT_8175 [Piloderma croceum F 1598]
MSHDLSDHFRAFLIIYDDFNFALPRSRFPMLSRALPRSLTLSHARALTPTFHVLHASLIAIDIAHLRAL